MTDHHRRIIDDAVSGLPSSVRDRVTKFVTDVLRAMPHPSDDDVRGALRAAFRKHVE